MMDSIKYHPLIERDFDTHEYVPVFVTTDESVVCRKHSLYLEEFVNGYYRVCVGKALKLPYGEMTIACPVCGSHLKNITTGQQKQSQALYVCPACNK